MLIIEIELFLTSKQDSTFDIDLVSLLCLENIDDPSSFFLSIGIANLPALLSSLSRLFFLLTAFLPWSDSSIIQSNWVYTRNEDNERHNYTLNNLKNTLLILGTRLGDGSNDPEDYISKGQTYLTCFYDRRGPITSIYFRRITESVSINKSFNCTPI